ncbi:iron-containing alcohol dehydrogenase [Geobacillus sp. 44B]|uniref:long-chain-alcohol dehydrogenase n=1 Tax=Saccharococcus caldoxylosilyticus TaxID=81408 RepID=A0A150LQF1_9BACL|nr:iron-containing alcohol dehydrogenase [Parageobacillus caldoxylosilyticus]KYD14518.1 Alcohol dehydrogenase [Parageobacillus caldoxylosilyticus]OQP03312.1 alcohol dehydrogenase [Geobacillus sp. 44B]QNU36771.1 iron-containing alcohol dehydrogenase [Geobacillus sp. 44B]
MQFQFGIPSQAIFGEGSIQKLPEVLAQFDAKKILLVYDSGVKAAGIIDHVHHLLSNVEADVVVFDKVLPNPPDTIVEEGAKLAKNEQVDAIVAVGGGSTIDCAKAINILLTNPRPIHQYDGLNLVKNPTKPLIAVPTTAGTGSEVTAFTVITDTTGLKKMVIGGQHCGATIALLDPELTIGLPPAVTAATGMDALTHAIEAYVSKAASIPSDINALKAVELIFHNLEEAYKNGTNKEARTNMLLGSMLAGYAFNSAVLGLVHAIAHPLSVHCGLAHGVANACCLPYVMEFNAECENVAKKYKDIAIAMGLNVQGLSIKESAQCAIDAVKELSKRIDIPTLRELGVRKEQFDRLAEDTLKEIAILFNPREATKEDVLRILEIAY